MFIRCHICIHGNVSYHLHCLDSFSVLCKLPYSTFEDSFKCQMTLWFKSYANFLLNKFLDERSPCFHLLLICCRCECLQSAPPFYLFPVSFPSFKFCHLRIRKCNRNCCNFESTGLCSLGTFFEKLANI